MGRVEAGRRNSLPATWCSYWRIAVSDRVMQARRALLLRFALLVRGRPVLFPPIGLAIDAYRAARRLHLRRPVGYVTAAFLC